MDKATDHDIMGMVETHIVEDGMHELLHGCMKAGCKAVATPATSSIATKANNSGGAIIG